jgi:hypothetical protein
LEIEKEIQNKIKIKNREPLLGPIPPPPLGPPLRAAQPTTPLHSAHRRCPPRALPLRQTLASSSTHADMWPPTISRRTVPTAPACLALRMTRGPHWAAPLLGSSKRARTPILTPTPGPHHAVSRSTHCPKPSMTGGTYASD